MHEHTHAGRKREHGKFDTQFHLYCIVLGSQHWDLSNAAIAPLLYCNTAAAASGGCVLCYSSIICQKSYQRKTSKCKHLLQQQWCAHSHFDQFESIELNAISNPCAVATLFKWVISLNEIFSGYETHTNMERLKWENVWENYL